MRYIKELINEELKKLNEGDRQTFREVSALTLKKLLEEFERRRDEFEKKIVDSNYEIDREKTIYTALIPKEDYAIYENDFYPILKEDLETEADKINRILEIESEEEEIILKTVNMKIDYEMWKMSHNDISINILDRETGELIYELEGRLEFDERYIEEMDKLYEMFKLNGVEWRTLNKIQAMSMYKVLVSKEELKELEIYDEEIKIDYGSVSEYVEEDKVLCWNIKERKLVGSLLVKPTKEQIYYETILRLKNGDRIYIYPSDKYIYHSYIDKEKNIHILSEEKDTNVWDIRELREINESKYKELNIEYMSNKQRKSLVEEYMKKGKSISKGESEIQRILNSNRLFIEYYRYKYYEIREMDIEEPEEELYDMNEFMLDEYRLKKDRKILKISGKILKYDSMTYYVLSFLKSEIELNFPEYKVLITEGV